MDDIIELTHQLSEILDKNVLGIESAALAEDLMNALLDEIQEQENAKIN